MTEARVEARFVVKWRWWALALCWLAKPVARIVSYDLACDLIGFAVTKGTRLVSMPPLRLDHGWTDEDTNALLAIPSDRDEATRDGPSLN